MHHRVSIVPFVNANSFSFSSIFEIGDSHGINLTSRAIAVQREYPLFVEDEANFSSYRIFSEVIPTPIIEEKVRTTFIHENPIIKVASVTLTGASNSAVLQIGSTNTIRAEARVKHIRQLLSD
ncbi:spore germination protein GerPE [Bacillus suaedaesalsae]|uniref:Spore germination protein GerPE n=1 Tax=Bacillus suaedaesalsae TaxID=2810349 RepID=A0ABS2DF94_9BACI|nr:spore germination protein GerPE [Bacillus suaedaesalsae]MBM6617135.1 spore germination protein GerPE [Bacillus suaedaesalsae]